MFYFIDMIFRQPIKHLCDFVERSFYSCREKKNLEESLFAN